MAATLQSVHDAAPIPTPLLLDQTPPLLTATHPLHLFEAAAGREAARCSGAMSASSLGRLMQQPRAWGPTPPVQTARAGQSRAGRPFWQAASLCRHPPPTGPCPPPGCWPPPSPSLQSPPPHPDRPASSPSQACCGRRSAASCALLWPACLRPRGQRSRGRTNRQSAGCREVSTQTVADLKPSWQLPARIRSLRFCPALPLAQQWLASSGSTLQSECRSNPLTWPGHRCRQGRHLARPHHAPRQHAGLGDHHVRHSPLQVLLQQAGSTSAGPQRAGRELQALPAPACTTQAQGKGQRAAVGSPTSAGRSLSCLPQPEPK